MSFFDPFGALDMFSDPSNASKKYLKQVPGAVGPQYQPYMQAGMSQLPGLQDQYSQLMGNPGQKLNDIGSNYHQSPGFEFALKQALAGSGNAAAAGGMAGSPQHEQQNMGIATGLADQDYNNYMNQALGLYGEGLSGSQGLYNTGFNASDQYAKMLQQNLQMQAQNAYAGKANQNSMWQGLAGAAAGAFF